MVLQIYFQLKAMMEMKFWMQSCTQSVEESSHLFPMSKKSKSGDFEHFPSVLLTKKLKSIRHGKKVKTIVHRAVM